MSCLKRLGKAMIGPKVQLEDQAADHQMITAWLVCCALIVDMKIG